MPENLNKRVLVDMSATLIHHGHIRLIHEASKLGTVSIGLTRDEDVLKSKGYLPELDFESRKEILLGLKFVDEVIPSPWVITDMFLVENNIDILVHGEDNFNSVSSEKLVLLPRTEGISSSMIRRRACANLQAGKNDD